MIGDFFLLIGEYLRVGEVERRGLLSSWTPLCESLIFEMILMRLSAFSAMFLMSFGLMLLGSKPSRLVLGGATGGFLGLVYSLLLDGFLTGWRGF